MLQNGFFIFILCFVQQVVFVILVNLQGCFIFAFHCIRNAKTRRLWRGRLESVMSQTQSVSLDQSTSTVSEVRRLKSTTTNFTDISKEKASEKL